jgi:hypothetical protein
MRDLSYRRRWRSINRVCKIKLSARQSSGTFFPLALSNANGRTVRI